uniref:ATP synthase subunit a n=1 Tax=Allobates flaviventris TaxID=1987119 RepID=A0A7M3UT13_9NEOB|nr:ATP synthase F0 subunit 6 [Allobates flaviventris]
MTLNLFTQFAPPSLLGITLFAVITAFPWTLVFAPRSRWLPNRSTALQVWFFKLVTKQIFAPISVFGFKWALILTSLMTFILGMNVLGLLPYTFTPTTQLSLNLGLAVPFWLATVLIGFRNQFNQAFGHFLPQGIPTPLSPVFIILETISLFIRPVALGVRLTANLTAGHLLLQLISMATFSLISSSVALSALAFTALLLLYLLEIAVAMIQAYVFILLLSLYLEESTDLTHK